MSEKTEPDTTAPDDQEQPLITHLLELRDRLLRMVLVVLVFFIAMFPFANDIYSLMAQPLMQHLPEGSSMVAIEVASPFLIPFKLVLMLSVVLSIPYILYQLWAFVAPGLYSNEKRLAMPLLVSSILLFYVGMAFAYFVVFPLVFGFFTSVAPEGVSVMTDIGHYLDFVNMLFLAFGIAFEVPVATVLLVAIGTTTPEKLAHYRPYVFVAAFIIGMFLTPPDVISQILLALPMWLLYELGIVFSRFVIAGKKDDQEEAAGEEQVATSEDYVPSDDDEASAGHSVDESVEPEAYAEDDEDYRPLTEEEMEAELDSLEFVDEDDEPPPTESPKGA
jgi:sec-independent protein translocase protein TatC